MKSKADNKGYHGDIDAASAGSIAGAF